MVAWLVAEDPYGLVRLDSITSVTAIPMNDRNVLDWDKRHPGSRMTEASRVRIMVASQGGQQACAVTCPGRSVQSAIDQLTALIEDPPRAGERLRLYVYGPRRSWSGNAQIWRIAEKLPDPDWPAVRA
jgi:hypothetical protein